LLRAKRTGREEGESSRPILFLKRVANCDIPGPPHSADRQTLLQEGHSVRGAVQSVRLSKQST